MTQPELAGFSRGPAGECGLIRARDWPVCRTLSRLRPAVLALVAVALLGSPAGAVEEDGQPTATVLVVQFSPSGYLPADGFNARLMRALHEHSAQRVDVQIEFLDVMVSRGEEYDRAVREYIRRKYAGARIVAVVGLGAQGAQMAVRLRAEVFPDAAVLYAVDRTIAQSMDFGHNSTGVLPTVDVPGTTALALRLVPATKHVAVVLGASDNERAWWDRVVSEIHAAAPGLDVIPLFGLERTEMLRRVSTLPEHTVLIWVAYRRDPSGETVAPTEVLAEVTTAVPVFGLFEYDFGSGIVGGRLVDLDRLGEESGLLAARIVNGERADAITPVVVTDYPVKVDWRAVRKWRIDPGLLPSDAVISFRQPTVWDEYGWYVAGGLAVFGVEAAIIAALLVERRRRRRAVAAFRASEQRSTAILRAAPDMMFLLSADGVYLDYYAKDADQLLVPPNAFLGRNMRDVLPREVAEAFAGALRAALASGGPEVVEYELNLSGRERSFEARIVAAGADTLLSVVRDVTEQRASDEARRRLTDRLLRLQDEERKRIAGELHDSLGQSLAIIRNRASICLRDVNNTDRVAEHLHEISTTAAASIDEVREIAHNLRPFELDQLGLTKAVRSMARRVSDSSGIRVVADVDLDRTKLSPEDETSVYRIVQEALNNVVRHAAASEARVSIGREGPDLVVTVSDDGRGVGPSDGRAGPANGDGFGLAAMAERARMLGGSFEVGSPSARGTTVKVTFPVPTVEAN